MQLRTNLIALGCTIALVGSIGITLFVNFQPNPGLEHRDLRVVVALWLTVFFVPPFLVGLRVNERGITYGLVIGLVPLIVAVLVGYRGPSLVAVVFYFLAPVGGFLGQHISARKRGG